MPAEKAGPLARYAATIQAQRGDYNGKVLSIRQDDLRTLAVIYDESPSELTEQLITWGVLNADARRALEADPATRLHAARVHRRLHAATGVHRRLHAISGQSVRRVVVQTPVNRPGIVQTPVNPDPATGRRRREAHRPKAG